MNFKPSFKKFMLVIGVIIILFFVDSITTCAGGAMSCKPPLEYCSCINSISKENYTSQIQSEMIMEKCAQANYMKNNPTDCLNMKCDRIKCGGIGGIITFIVGAILSYIIYSLLQKKS